MSNSRGDYWRIGPRVITYAAENCELPETTNLPSFFPDFCVGKVEHMQKPRKLGRQAIEEFKEIYEGEFGQRLSDDEVREIALNLLWFFGIRRAVNPGKFVKNRRISKSS